MVASTWSTFLFLCGCMHAHPYRYWMPNAMPLAEFILNAMLFLFHCSSKCSCTPPGPATCPVTASAMPSLSENGRTRSMLAKQRRTRSNIEACALQQLQRRLLTSYGILFQVTRVLDVGSLACNNNFSIGLLQRTVRSLGHNTLSEAGLLRPQPLPPSDRSHAGYVLDGPSQNSIDCVHYNKA